MTPAVLGLFWLAACNSGAPDSEAATCEQDPFLRIGDGALEACAAGAEAGRVGARARDAAACNQFEAAFRQYEVACESHLSPACCKAPGSSWDRYPDVLREAYGACYLEAWCLELDRIESTCDRPSNCPPNGFP